MPTSTARPARPAPRVSPRDRPFWEGCARGELHVIRCDDCGETWFPSQERCPACRSRRWRWVPVENTGTLYTYTVIHGPGTEGRPPGFELPYPYVVGIVEIDGGEGARIPGNVLDVPVDSVQIGMRLRASFRDGEPALPDFVAESA